MSYIPSVILRAFRSLLFRDMVFSLSLTYSNLSVNSHKSLAINHKNPLDSFFITRSYDIIQAMNEYGKGAEKLTWDRLLLLNKFAVEEIYTKLRILNEEFSHEQQNNPIEHIKTRVKKKRSIVKKLKSKGLAPTPENASKHLMDIAGVRLICSFTSDIYRMLDALKKQDDLKVIKIKDYIESPKANGYQSLHMLVEVPVFLSGGSQNMCVEIQIRTIAMDFWASLEHKLYYKYDNQVPDHITDELKECAHIINDLDSRMLNIKFQIDNYDEGYEKDN